MNKYKKYMDRCSQSESQKQALIEKLQKEEPAGTVLETQEAPAPRRKRPMRLAWAALIPAAAIFAVLILPGSPLSLRISADHEPVPGIQDGSGSSSWISDLFPGKKSKAESTGNADPLSPQNQGQDIPPVGTEAHYAEEKQISDDKRPPEEKQTEPEQRGTDRASDIPDETYCPVPPEERTDPKGDVDVSYSENVCKVYLSGVPLAALQDYTRGAEAWEALSCSVQIEFVFEVPDYAGPGSCLIFGLCGTEQCLVTADRLNGSFRKLPLSENDYDIIKQNLYQAMEEEASKQASRKSARADETAPSLDAPRSQQP